MTNAQEHINQVTIASHNSSQGRQVSPTKYFFPESTEPKTSDFFSLISLTFLLSFLCFLCGYLVLKD